ncbi:hypothetical protein B296_00051051 [Ensete ventricosum]|uniref:ATP synthase F1 complex delta/epsilon subunit N-terminal domain-containing protein n=1 Tax=Ensete ventricosum TaxID=4639 RepID=A0A426XJA6_ENSVE|nr:hypothetical protein B296_00051051 [Ensete ventricosum]
MYRQASRRLIQALGNGGRRRPFSTDLPAAPTEDAAFVEAWRKVAPNIDPPKTPLAFMKPRPPTPSSIPSKLTVNFVLPYQSEIANKEVRSSDKLLELSSLRNLCYDQGWACPTHAAWHILGCMVLILSTLLSIELADAGVFRVCIRLTYPTNAGHWVDMVIVPATTGQMGVLPGHVATIAELKPGVLSVHEGNEVTKYFVSSGFAFIHANSVTDIVAVEAVPVDRIDPSLVQKGLADFTQKLNSASTDLEKAEAQIGVDVHSALNAALSG